VSTFAPTRGSQGWSAAVTAGTTGAFEIVSIDVEKKRIGVALVPEGSARAGATDDFETEDTAKDAAPAEAFGSLADKLRGALKPREK